MSRDHRFDRRDRGPQRPPEPPQPDAPPAQAAQEETIGGKSAKDEVATTIANQIIGKMLWMLASWKPIEVALADLSPVARKVSEALPSVATYAVAKLPRSLFRTPELADAFKDIVMDASKTVNEIVQKGGEAKPSDYAVAIDKAYDAVMAKKVAVDPLGQFHLTDCLNLRQAFKKDDCEEITLKGALDQGVKACPYCHPRVQAELRASSAPKQAKRGRSPLEIVGASPNEELRKEFHEWLKSLDAAQRERALVALRELDSDEEFIGFMAMDPAHRIEILSLLENRNANHAVGHFLGILGSAVKSGAGDVVARLKAFDQGFAPKVAELKERRAKRIAERKAGEGPKKPDSWWKRHVSPWLEMLLPF